MAEKDFFYYVKAQVTSTAIENQFPSSPVSKRELEIQIDKLRRMVEAYGKRFPMGLASGLSTSAAKLRKQKGPHLYRLAQQSKRVDALLSKWIEANIKSMYPHAALKLRKKIPANARYATKVFNDKIHKGAQLLLSGVTGDALLAGIHDLKRLPGKRKG
jgi:hypothetical protein